MSNTATLSFSRTGRGLFTRDEVRALMQIEFERAERYSYPIACMLIQVDHLAQIQTVHGHEAKEEVLFSIIDLVKGATRAGDLLGYIVDDRLMAVVPHTHPVAAKALAERLLKGARELAFALEGRTIRITLSIGLSHNQDPGAKSFATLERVSEEGLDVADNGGGDRCVQTELYQLYEREKKPVSREDIEDLLARAEKMGYRQRLESLVQGGADLEVAAETVAEEIIDRAVDAARQDWEKELAEANAEVVRLSAESLKSPAGSPDEDLRREVEQLHRRIAKLTGSLEMTEQEIARLRKLKNVDDGVASLYRDVQGLGDGDARSEVKKELMGEIFRANMHLQGKKVG
ncbi:putative diguanylate cyclase YedQ [Planctomycetes bacterium Poly30]|uniref:diguanylate cyclase n=1 Tax=Saltatorellus ferox TaxID=2528018 RepID=A0A518EST9_9BACT|nr:putative diguanylate cyclase YedQ [Planctomycetes bacterium Poly30]